MDIKHENRRPHPRPHWSLTYATQIESSAVHTTARHGTRHTAGISTHCTARTVMPTTCSIGRWDSTPAPLANRSLHKFMRATHYTLYCGRFIAATHPASQPVESFMSTTTNTNTINPLSSQILFSKYFAPISDIFSIHAPFFFHFKSYTRN